MVVFHQQMKVRKKHWKIHFLGRIFFFIQIAYIILVKGDLFKMPLIFLKTLKNTSFTIFFRKKVYCGNIQCFLFFVWWKQWKYEKALKKSLFRQNFLLYSNCIYYTCKRGFCLNAVNTPKTVEKHVIYYFFQKKSILWQYSVFFVFV